MLGDTALEMLDFVRENDVKFIRLAFCDLFGAKEYRHSGRPASPCF